MRIPYGEVRNIDLIEHQTGRDIADVIGHLIVGSRQDERKAEIIIDDDRAIENSLPFGSL
ncbi:hypothetical protein BC427_22560 (plasmid) [Ralstonia solanacearum FJAT-91]|nr:hypothetical protein BC427_22560 [Ralstonia solanacearum FJAT-91]